jgi:hypothetical protein
VELENFMALPPTPDHDLLMNVLAQDPSSHLDDAALLWFNTKTFKRVASGPIFFGGVESNGTAPGPNQGAYVGNWAQLERVDDASKYLVVQGHFSHNLQPVPTAYSSRAPRFARQYPVLAAW